MERSTFQLAAETFQMELFNLKCLIISAEIIINVYTLYNISKYNNYIISIFQYSDEDLQLNYSTVAGIFPLEIK